MTATESGGRSTSSASFASDIRAIPPIPAVRFRALRPDDADALVTLLQAAREVDGPQEPTASDELRHLWLEHPGVTFETDSLVAEAPDGSLAGAVAVYARDTPRTIARAFLPGAVHPAYRRQGIGSSLLRFAELRGRELLGTVDTAIPRQIDCESPSTAHDRVALFEAHGFRSSRAFITMHRALGRAAVAVPDLALPDGVRAVSWSADLDEATRLAHNDAFRDHWGSDPQSRERWRHFVADAPGFRADCSWLAMADNMIAGYTLVNLNEMPDGSLVGWLGTIGVRRTWRQRGIASALIARTLASLAAVGASRAGLDVDAENPTGAVHVYESLGFEATDTSIIFSKPIEP